MENYDEESALLVGQAGALNGHRWAIQSEMIIGRDANCEIVVPDRQVSRQHAKITATPTGMLLEDLRSKNGTYWNGKAVSEPVLLQDGDEIQIALAQNFVYLSSDATVPLELTEGMQQSQLKSIHSEEFLPPTANLRLRLDPLSRSVLIKTRAAAAEDQIHQGEWQDMELDPPLSSYQFRLLQILYENHGQVVSRPEIIAFVWGETQAVIVSEQALDALIRRLRDRIRESDPSHEYLVTVRGHGFRLDPTGGR